MSTWPINQNNTVSNEDGSARLAINPDGSLNTSAVGYAYENITTSDTTLVKTGAGVLASVTVNTLGTVASAVVLHDGLTDAGPVIGTIDSLTLSGQFAYGIAFGTGLTVVTTGAPDITVSYS